MSLTGTGLVDWIALRRVREGGVAIHGSGYVDHGRRVPCYLPEAFDRLAEAGLTDLRDADYPGQRGVVLTPRGRIRYQELESCTLPCRHPSTPRDFPPDPGRSSVLSAHKPFLVPGDRPAPRNITQWKPS